MKSNTIYTNVLPIYVYDVLTQRIQINKGPRYYDVEDREVEIQASQGNMSAYYALWRKRNSANSSL